MFPKWAIKFFIIFGIILFTALGVSYFVLYRLIGRRPMTSEIVAKIEESRKELITQYDAKPVTFESCDGVKLAGLAINRVISDGVVILCHGYHREKEHLRKYVDLFKNYDIFMFDFRACGESEGLFSSMGCFEYNDVVAAVKYVRENFTIGRKPVILFGTSMGAASAIRAMGENPGLVDAAILDSSYASLKGAMKDAFNHKVSYLPYMPFYYVLYGLFYAHHGEEVSKMNPELFVSDAAVPMLFIHSSSDDFVSSQHTVRLYAKAKENATTHADLWIGPPAIHTKLYHNYPDEYRKRIREFLRKIQERF